jgi:hypothetical protein
MEGTRISPTEWEYTLGAEGSTHVVDPGTTTPFLLHCFTANWPRPPWKAIPRIRNGSCTPPFPTNRNTVGQWMAPTLLSVHNPDIVYHGVQYVLKSTDRGAPGTGSVPTLPTTIRKNRAIFPTRPFLPWKNRCLIPSCFTPGTDDGRLWRTKDGGTELGGHPNRSPFPIRWVSQDRGVRQHEFRHRLCHPDRPQG